MGIQGLWRYLDNHNLSRHLGAASDKLEPQHLLLDMNSIMHKAYDPKRPTTEATIDAVVKSVKTFVTKFPPNKSLTLAFDGVAPIAKLPTQRERRRKTVVGATAALQKGMELQQGQIITGSLFVHKCEEAVIGLIRRLVGQGDIKTSEPVFVSTYRSPGEGDTKMFKRLHALAAEYLEKKTYNPNDIVVIVGSDCDLVLGCAACTPFHNMFLMSPVTHLLTDIGELFTHWMKRSSGDLVPVDMLPSLRIDFVFCIALAGGDHFNGLEDRAIELWRRYRHLRLDGGFFRRPLIINNSFQICWDFLTQMVSRDRKALLSNFVGSKNKKARKKQELAKEAESGGSGDVQSGIDLLKGALWSVAAYTEGKPPAMDAKFYSANPKASSIRVVCARGRQHVSVPRTQYESLPPISVYLGAIGVKSVTPHPFDEIMSLPIHKNFSSLTSGTSILAHVTQMIHTATKKGGSGTDGSLAVSAEILNRTEEDDLLDNAIAAAASATPNTPQVTTENVAMSNNAKRRAAKEAERAAQLAADALVSANSHFNLPDSVMPLLETRPAHEWTTITLSGPIVPKTVSRIEVAPEPANKVSVTEHTGKHSSQSKGGNKVNSKNKGASPGVTKDSIVGKPSCSADFQSKMREDAEQIAAAVAATSMSSIVLRDASTAISVTSIANRSSDSGCKNAPMSSQATITSAEFVNTLNTVDFAYPDYVTTIQISSVIVHRKIASAPDDRVMSEQNDTESSDGADSN